MVLYGINLCEVDPNIQLYDYYHIFKGLVLNSCHIVAHYIVIVLCLMANKNLDKLLCP